MTTTTNTFDVSPGFTLTVRTWFVDVDGYEIRASVFASNADTGVYLSRASSTSENGAIELALHAAGWEHYHRRVTVASEKTVAKVNAALAARLAGGRIIEARRVGFYGVAVD